MTITIESFEQIWNQWEIQLVVLLSFTLQIFLFFTGCIRRYNKNALLRLFIWLAYVGANMVAVYALGLISKNDQSAGSNGLTACTPGQLAFFWAPFLLIHLGGQDTLTSCILHRGQQPVAEAPAEPGHPSLLSLVCLLEVDWWT
jgi:hypothetical protein